MSDPDSIFHDLANQDPTGLAQLVLGDPTVEAEGLPHGLPIVRRREADALLLVRRGSERILLHVECDLGRHRIAPRLLEYASILAKREHRRARKGTPSARPIVSAVLRLRGAGHPPRRIRHVVPGLDGATIVFRYHQIDVNGLEATDLLASAHPALWALVPLARGGESEAVLERAVAAIDKARVAPEQRAALLTSSWIFAAIAGSHRIIERLVHMRRFRDIPAVKELLQEGEAKGLAKGLAEGEAKGEAKGLAEGEAKGLAEGEAKGLAEGEAKGLAEGEAKALRGVLLSRFERLGRVPPQLARKIAGLTDVAELGRLVTIALDSDSVAAFKTKAFPRPRS